MSEPADLHRRCTNCEAIISAETTTDSTLCKTCGLAKRLLEAPQEEAATSADAKSAIGALTDGLLAGVVTTTSWVILAAISPWIPSFLWCFFIGGAISFAMRSKMPKDRPDLLALGIGLIGSLSALTGVYGVRLRYINGLQQTQGLPELPLWPGRETFLQVSTAGETAIGFAQLMVLIIAIIAGGIVAGVLAD
jgi:vacuolar-type H+-ATPase subunit I/STV1